MVRPAKYGLLVLLTMLLAATSSLAQPLGIAPDANPPTRDLASDTRLPTDVDDNFLQASGAQAHFESGSKVSDSVKLALGQNRIISVPHFSSSFADQGKTFPFTMVGRRPQDGVTTRIGTQLIPISMFFEGYEDEDGNPIVLDVTPRIADVLNSPNFHKASYQTGPTQFADAVQRAQFFHVMDAEWHTMLGDPQLLPSLNVDVPRGYATVYRVRSTGVIFAVVEEGFFISQLNTIIQMANLDVRGLPIALTTNVFLAPGATLRRCCVLGFHTSFDVGQQANRQLVQTFMWASWVDAGIFGGTLADITAMSHEISEWMNDPFNTNMVAEWQFPNGAGGCQSNLETADPLSISPHSAFPVMIEGFTYHPQNQALLQWFQRKTPSDAIDGAFSFPDETLLTSPAQPCK